MPDVVTLVMPEGSEHTIGNMACDEGWCGLGYGFPKKCDCGGVIHADYGTDGYNTETDEDQSVVDTECDACHKVMWLFVGGKP